MLPEVEAARSNFYGRDWQGFSDRRDDKLAYEAPASFLALNQGASYILINIHTKTYNQGRFLRSTPVLPLTVPICIQAASFSYLCGATVVAGWY